MHELHGPDEAGTDADVDEHERPTLPQIVVTTPEAITLPGISLARVFDADAERFFAAAPELEGDDEAEEGLAEWWITQRRKAFAGWVTAIVVACAVVFAVGVLGS